MPGGHWWDQIVSPIGSVSIGSGNDTLDIIGGPIRAFMVGGAGDVSIKFKNGSTGLFPQCQLGAIYPALAATRIFATGTGASGIWGLL